MKLSSQTTKEIAVKSLYKVTGWIFSSPSEVSGTCCKFESQLNQAMRLQKEGVNRGTGFVYPRGAEMEEATLTAVFTMTCWPHSLNLSLSLVVYFLLIFCPGHAMLLFFSEKQVK